MLPTRTAGCQFGWILRFSSAVAVCCTVLPFLSPISSTGRYLDSKIQIISVAYCYPNNPFSNINTFRCEQTGILLEDLEFNLLRCLVAHSYPVLLAVVTSSALRVTKAVPQQWEVGSFSLGVLSRRGTHRASLISDKTSSSKGVSAAGSVEGRSRRLRSEKSKKFSVYCPVSGPFRVRYFESTLQNTRPC